ncbi:MAG: L-threonate dehydrogenase [Pseudomonadota bacterium]
MTHSNNSSGPTCAVIGLGSMGLGMAESCIRAGLTTYGIDLNTERTAQFVSRGGKTDHLAKIAPEINVAVIVVMNAVQTRELLTGSGALIEKLRPGSVVVACATVPPEFAREMEAACCEQGIHYLDAPISGGAQKAAMGSLSIMASGSAQAFETARPVLDATAESVFKLGDAAGPGSAMKAVNQLLAGVHIAAMAEALTFGMTQGVAPDQFLKVISQCAGTSWMLENRAPHVVEGDYEPRSSVTIWPKDLGIVLEIAKSTGFDAPITAAALAQYEKAVDMGLGSEDDAAVAKVYARKIGIQLPGEAA